MEFRRMAKDTASLWQGAITIALLTVITVGLGGWYTTAMPKFEKDLRGFIDSRVYPPRTPIVLDPVVIVLPTTTEVAVAE